MVLGPHSVVVVLVLYDPERYMVPRLRVSGPPGSDRVIRFQTRRRILQSATQRPFDKNESENEAPFGRVRRQVVDLVVGQARVGDIQQADVVRQRGGECLYERRLFRPSGP
jgi:hypothetical protein